MGMPSVCYVSQEEEPLCVDAMWHGWSRCPLASKPVHCLSVIFSPAHTKVAASVAAAMLPLTASELSSGRSSSSSREGKMIVSVR